MLASSFVGREESRGDIVDLSFPGSMIGDAMDSLFICQCCFVSISDLVRSMA